MDLKGPVIRIGDLTDGLPVKLKAGQEFRILCKNNHVGDSTFGVCDYKDLPSKLKVGDRIIVDFGSVSLAVTGFENEKDFLERKELERLQKEKTIMKSSVSY